LCPMRNVLPVARIVLATLGTIELASVLTRLRHREARREAAWLAAVLAAFCLRLLLPRSSLADILIPIAVIACAASLLLALNQRRGMPSWALAALAAAGLLCALELARLPPALLRVIDAAALALLSVPAFLLLALLQRKTGEHADLLLLAMAAGWVGASCAEAAGLISPGASDWLIAPLLLLIAFMLFEQGYLSPLTSSGYVDRLAAERRLMRRTYARLLESRDALVLQDRLIAAGLLALGAAHEFKDVLAAVRLAAEHGRAGEGSEHKDRCLELVAEHAAAGGASAAEFLERLGREGREQPARIDVRELIDHLVRIARPSWRAAGITLSMELGDGLAIVGRRREVEQVLLNLLRNAVDAIELSPNCTHEIHIRAQKNGRTVEISVSDKAGGIPSKMAGSLFALRNTGTGSTGIGLYLARDLAMRNDGALTYSPIASGSCFVLSLPGILI